MVDTGGCRVQWWWAWRAERGRKVGVPIDVVTVMRDIRVMTETVGNIHLGFGMNTS